MFLAEDALLMEYIRRKNVRFMSKIQFSQAAKEGLQYYVYCLVNPSDGKVFYIGKGTGDRVYQHAIGAIEGDAHTEKLDLIRRIINEDKKDVQYYIVRHGMDSDTAFEVEAALIDFLTYPRFNLENVLTNIVAGKDQWDRGIKTDSEIEQTYSVEPMVVDDDDFILCVNLNKSYRKGCDIYEITRGWWIVGKEARKKITHVIGIYRGIVRGVYRPEKWSEVVDEKGVLKCCFEGEALNDSSYMNKDARNVVKINPYGRPSYIKGKNHNY